MSLLKSDARAAVPPEYSDSDPRNPNNLTANSQANLDQMTADSSYDDQPKKRVIKENFEVYGGSQGGSAAVASVSLLGLMALLLMARMSWH
jgi:hypothetical protein